MARVVVSVGGDGTITSVNVASPFAGTPAATCMERAIRGVRMPATGAPYQFRHAYRPAPVAGSSSATSPAQRAPARRRMEPSVDSMADPFE